MNQGPTARPSRPRPRSTSRSSSPSTTRPRTSSPSTPRSTPCCGAQNLSYEIIFVDDGSTDGTSGPPGLNLQRLDPTHVRVAYLRRNCGQTAALSAALDFARGRVLVPLDGDRQNDPADIPRLLAKLDEGYDVVSGWRKTAARQVAHPPRSLPDRQPSGCPHLGRRSP